MAASSNARLSAVARKIYAGGKPKPVVEVPCVFSRDAKGNLVARPR